MAYAYSSRGEIPGSSRSRSAYPSPRDHPRTHPEPVSLRRPPPDHSGMNNLRPSSSDDYPRGPSSRTRSDQAPRSIPSQARRPSRALRPDGPEPSSQRSTASRGHDEDQERVRSIRRGPNPSRSNRSEDEARSQEPGPAPDPAPAAWGWESIKKTVWGDEKETEKASQLKQTESEPNPEEQSNTLWSKIALVGASLQKKIVGEDGYASDATDYEGDSHLIRIMKEYHIQQADSQRDLPTWLFSSDEILSADPSTRIQTQTDPLNPRSNPQLGPAHRKDDLRPGALTDIYESVNQTQASRHQRGYPASPRHNTSFDSGYASGGPSPPPSRQKYGSGPPGDQEPTKPSVGRNRLIKPSGPTPRPPPPGRGRRTDLEDHGAQDRGRRSEYGHSRHEYGEGGGGSSVPNRTRPTHRPTRAAYEDDQPLLRTRAPPSSRGYAPRGYER